MNCWGRHQLLGDAPLHCLSVFLSGQCLILWLSHYSHFSVIRHELKEKRNSNLSNVCKLNSLYHQFCNADEFLIYSTVMTTHSKNWKAFLVDLLMLLAGTQTPTSRHGEPNRALLQETCSEPLSTTRWAGLAFCQQWPHYRVWAHSDSHSQQQGQLGTQPHFEYSQPPSHHLLNKMADLYLSHLV